MENLGKVVIFDTETTGAKQPYRIIEAAYLELNCFYDIEREFCQRYNPEMKITTGAMATHHILDSEVANCPPWHEFQLPGDTEYVIGHKVDFDLEAIGLDPGVPIINENGKQVKRICTLAIARKHLPDSDSHQQSALMYEFYGPGAREVLKDAHSALADVRNCRSVLLRLLDLMEGKGIAIRTIDDLWQESERCRIPDIITFGMHDGTQVVDLPYSYKQWLLKQDWLDPYMRIAVNNSMKKKNG